jgi:hypothetical protein
MIAFAFGFIVGAAVVLAGAIWLVGGFQQLRDMAMAKFVKM